jgi:hypothetical protein
VSETGLTAAAGDPPCVCANRCSFDAVLLRSRAPSTRSPFSHCVCESVFVPCVNDHVHVVPRARWRSFVGAVGRSGCFNEADRFVHGHSCGAFMRRREFLAGGFVPRLPDGVRDTHNPVAAVLRK